VLRDRKKGKKDGRKTFHRREKSTGTYSRGSSNTEGEESIGTVLGKNKKSATTRKKIAEDPA